MKRLGCKLALIYLLSAPLLAYPQCSLCRDTTAGSAPKIRQGLQRAILVLGLPAGVIFSSIFLLARRIPPREETSQQSPDEQT